MDNIHETGRDVTSYDFQFFSSAIFLRVTAPTNNITLRLLGVTVVCAMCIKQCYINNALKLMLQIILPQYLQVRTKKSMFDVNRCVVLKYVLL